MFNRRVAATLAAMSLIVMAAQGCSRIQEPWVGNDQQLSDERTRSADEGKMLRDRLASSQIDR